MITGWKIPLPDGVPGLFVGGFYCFAVMWIVILVVRFLGAALHFALEPHRRPLVILRERLGNLMWPIISMATGIFLFAILCGGGLVWLALQIRGGAGIGASAEAKTNETPNTVGNPDFFLQVPEGRYRFKWDPMTQAKFELRLDTERNPDFGNNPAFIVRNKTNTVAYNVLAVWKSEIASSVDELTKSPKLSKFKFDVAETRLVIVPPPGSTSGGFLYYLDDSPKQTIAVIAKEAEVYFPQQLWALAALYFIDKMPTKIGESTEPYIARVTLNWETSEGKKQRAYRVRVTATNSKVTASEMPVTDAFLNFSLEEII
jgi:hypothetical protein